VNVNTNGNLNLNAKGRPVMTTRRALLASAALAPLVAGGLRPARAQEATPQTQVEDSPDLSEMMPLPLAGDRLAAFEAYVAAALAEAGVPGAAVAVVQDGEVVFAQGFGVRELGQPGPVTADTLLRIGSVTKSFSSLLAATLVDAGRLSWETPLVDLLPEFAVADPELAPRLTVRDAFCACSGLPRRDLEFMLRADDFSPERMIAGMADLPLTAEYGERYQYSNQMVGAGGFAAAVADGGSPAALSHAYAVALRERVLNPIGMARTTLDLAAVAAGNDYATPHATDLAGTLRALPLMEDDAWLVPVAPSGSLWSSAAEMARYVQTELAGGVGPAGARVVSAENLERTWRPGIPLHTPPGTPPDIAAFAGHYGLGWVVGAYRGQRAVWHSGGTLGFTSLVTFLPEADLGIVVLTNAVGSTASPVVYGATFRLFELLFEQPASFDAEQAPRLAAAAEARADLLTRLGQIDPATVEPFLGWYANPTLGAARLSLRDNVLTFAAGAMRAELRPLLDDAGAVTGYLPFEPPLGGFPPSMSLAFERDGDGRPTIVLTEPPSDAGEGDVVYVFDAVDAPAAAGTPTP
jgi:CubicO group peptidase (beta-lactamase class C family)